MVTYLSDASECGTITGPQAVVHAIRFFEGCGGRADEDSVANLPWVRGALQVSVSSVAEGKERAAKKSAHYPLEGIVVGRFEVPGYRRLLAWARLVRIWSATRFDDLLHVRPAGVYMEGGHLVLELPRTKTTGPGKRVQLMHAYVAGDAYIREPEWLKAGYGLLKELAGHIPRDYLLPLPDSSYEGVRPSPLVYSDSLRFGRLLLRDLCRPDGRPMLEPEAALMWTEHGLRAQLATWGSLLGVDRHILDHIGRWGEAKSSGYIRARKELALEGQSVIAGKSRERWHAGGGFPGETGIASDLRVFLKRRGWSDARIDSQVDMIFDGRLEQGQHALPPAPAPEKLAEPPSSDDEPIKGTGDAAYSVARVGRTGRRTLHTLPGCGRQPGIHYTRYDLFDTLPPPGEYTAICQKCWPDGLAQDHDGLSDGGASATSSSSVTSSESAE